MEMESNAAKKPTGQTPMHVSISLMKGKQLDMRHFIRIF